MITLYRRLIIVALLLLTLDAVFAEPVEVPEPLVVYKTILEQPNEVEVKPEVKVKPKANTIIEKKVEVKEVKKVVEVKKAVSSRQAEADAQPDFSTREVQELIRKYAGIYGVDETWALNIAGCESGYRAKVKNKNSSAASVYQQLERFRPARAKKYGREGYSRFHAEANIAVSIQMLANEGGSHRNESKYCWNK